jgi:hypothetical protein
MARISDIKSFSLTIPHSERLFQHLSALRVRRATLGCRPWHCCIRQLGRHETSNTRENVDALVHLNYPAGIRGLELIAVLKFVGIGVISVFTATLASFFFTTDEESETARLERRLKAIEATLDDLTMTLKDRR